MGRSDGEKRPVIDGATEPGARLNMDWLYTIDSPREHAVCFQQEVDFQHGVFHLLTELKVSVPDAVRVAVLIESDLFEVDR
jgi:hypothetical protein